MPLDCRRKASHNVNTMADTMQWRQIVSSRHFPYLVAGLAVPLLASVLVVVDGERIAFCFLPEVVLPQSCFSRTVLNFDCPLCGLTRSVIYLVQGNLAASLAMHRLGWFVFLVILAQIPYRLWCLSGRSPKLLATSVTEIYCWTGLLALLVLNRAWDLIARF